MVVRYVSKVLGGVQKMAFKNERIDDEQLAYAMQASNLRKQTDADEHILKTADRRIGNNRGADQPVDKELVIAEDTVNNVEFYEKHGMSVRLLLRAQCVVLANRHVGARAEALMIHTSSISLVVR